MQQLGNMKENFDDLSDPEQFACLVSGNSILPLSPTPSIPNFSLSGRETIYLWILYKAEITSSPFLQQSFVSFESSTKEGYLNCITVNASRKSQQVGNLASFRMCNETEMQRIHVVYLLCMIISCLLQKGEPVDIFVHNND